MKVSLFKANFLGCQPEQICFRDLVRDRVTVLSMAVENPIAEHIFGMMGTNPFRGVCSTPETWCDNLEDGSKSNEKQWGEFR